MIIEIQRGNSYMSLLSDWREFAYQQHDDRTADGKKFWQGYFDQETAVYKEILADPDHPVSGTVAELAEKFHMINFLRKLIKLQNP